MITKILGEYKRAYLAYSAEESIRMYAASGGVCTAMLVHAIESGMIDGALGCKTVIVDGKVGTEFVIATTRQELLECRGSKYVVTKFTSEVPPLIKNFTGRLAVVGLPCEISFIRRWMDRDPAIKEKIHLTIALICGHTSQAHLIHRVTESLENEANSRLATFYFRIGHWRGKLRAEFENGVCLEKPSSEFLLYQNLYFFAEKKCLYCSDHFGYHADITVGDVWAIQFKKLPIKHSGVITRTTIGENFFQQCVDNGVLQMSPTDIDLIMDGQARGAPWHYNISARHKVSKLFGLTIPDTTHEAVTWHEYLATLIILFNWTWSQNPKWAPLIFTIPRGVLKVYLYILTALRSLE